MGETSLFAKLESPSASRTETHLQDFEVCFRTLCVVSLSASNKSLAAARLEGLSLRMSGPRQFAVEISDLAVLATLDLFDSRRKRDWLGILESLPVEVRVEVKSRGRVFVATPDDFLANPLLEIQLSDFGLTLRPKVCSLKSVMIVNVKGTDVPIPESLVELLELEATVEVRRAPEESSFSAKVDVGTLHLNLKPDFIDTFAFISAYTKGEKSPNYFNRFQVTSQLEAPFALVHQGQRHVVWEASTNIPLAPSAFPNKPSPNITSWAKKRPVKQILPDFAATLRQMETDFLGASMTKRGRIGSTSDSKGECVLEIGGKTFHVDFDRSADVCLVHDAKGPVAIMLQTSILDLNYCLNLRTNVRFRNNSHLKLIVKLFRNTPAVGPAKATPASGEAAPRPLQKVIKIVKLRPHTEFFLPFCEDYSLVTYSIGLSGKGGEETEHSLADLFTHKSSFVVCSDGENLRPVHFSVLLKESSRQPASPLDLEAAVGGLREQLVSIEAPIVVKNRLPLKLRLIFVNDSLHHSLKKSVSLSQSLRSLSDTAQCEVACSEFGDEVAHKFVVPEFNSLFVNSTSNGAGIRLREEPSGLLAESAETVPPRKEQLVVHLQQSLDSLLNGILEIETVANQIRLHFSSELLFVNELRFAVKVRVREEEFEYDRLTLPDHDALFRDDQSTKNLPASYFSLEDLSNPKTAARLLKRKAGTIGCFSGDLSNSKKGLTFEAEDTSVQINLRSFRDKARQLVVLNRRSVMVSLLHLEPSVASKGFLFLYYPVFLVNRTDDDLLIRAHSSPESLVILKRDVLFASDDLLPPKKALLNCEFVMKGSSNDLDWSDAFCLLPSDRLPALKSFYVSPRLKSGEAESNLCLSVTSTDLSQLVTITRNTRPNFRICNNLKSAVYVSQFDRRGAQHVPVLPNTVADYFYQNSFVNNELCFFRRSQTVTGASKVSLLHRVDFRQSPKPVVVEAKGFEAFEIIVERERNNDWFIVRLMPRHSKTEELNFRNAGPKLMGFFESGPKLKGLFESTLKNKSFFPFTFDVFSGGRFPSADTKSATLGVRQLLFSLCDGESREAFLVRLEDLGVSVVRSTTHKTRTDEVAVTVGDFQVDSQFSFVLHGVC